MTAEIDPERRLGALVRDNPEFASVFESVGIDYCCGGDALLERACADADLEVGAVVERLRDARSDGGDGTDDWDSLSALVDDIVENHHDYLRAELPSLERTVRKVVRVHGDDHPELHDVESTFLDLEDEVTHHIEDEEENVFPELERLEDETALTGDEEAQVREAIDHLEDEHDAAAAHLERLRSLTDDYAVPEGACTSYRNMLDRLQLLEEDMHLHIHKENNVLFPDAQDRLATAVAE
ncbi:iron-sulfur cluster repair di-iron protein [Haloterrigena turkmenica DSM 5511]|uniref:Iron-sulfur cluster repair di-iron protein n=1 Tax=Haloterrigena turkmenica (strain ATCC 51198 / DSM 5511 / JCM 9101 / NCIMB 13204 / VKM B-1734 / 4k) TaxID=543526 RepID=D2RT39_HALTV|nr:iron-sulfur cluster repair di-iron protein [Haloterrigena turkmenica]ADB60919.1 iron-sulfur cluster repair di-iron protein [Haloterrigena turkmenica DSM 5511]